MTVAQVPRQRNPRTAPPLGDPPWAGRWALSSLPRGVLVVGLSDITATRTGLSRPGCGLQEGTSSPTSTTPRSGPLRRSILQDLEGQEMELDRPPGRGEPGGDHPGRPVQHRRRLQAGRLGLLHGRHRHPDLCGPGDRPVRHPGTRINDVDTAVLMKLQSPLPPPPWQGGQRVNGRPGNSRGPSPPARTWAPYTPTRTSGVFGHLQDPGVHGHPLCLWPQRRRSTPDRPPSQPNVAGTGGGGVHGGNSQSLSNTSDTWDLMLRVTDPRLLEKTGGIVQGMSGSPILQGQAGGASPTCSSTMRTGATAFWPRTCWTRRPGPNT